MARAQMSLLIPRQTDTVPSSDRIETKVMNPESETASMPETNTDKPSMAQSGGWLVDSMMICQPCNRLARS
jgi:hypothetical protein